MGMRLVNARTKKIISMRQGSASHIAKCDRMPIFPSLLFSRVMRVVAFSQAHSLYPRLMLRRLDIAAAPVCLLDEAKLQPVARTAQILWLLATKNIKFN